MGGSVASRGAWLVVCLAVGCGGGGGGASGGNSAGGTGSAAAQATTSGGAHDPTQASGGPGASEPGGADAGATEQAGGAESDAGFVSPQQNGANTAQAARLFDQGTAAYARGDFAAAVQAFRQAYELYPSADMAYNVARVYERMGEVGDAVAFFQRVLAANPDPAQRAEIEGRIAALRAYEQRRREGIAQAPPSRDALSEEALRWFNNGIAHYRRRRYRQALIAFEQAYQYSHTPELFYNLANTHEQLGNIDRAIEFYREYLSARRGTPEQAEIERTIQRLEQRR